MIEGESGANANRGLHLSTRLSIAPGQTAGKGETVPRYVFTDEDKLLIVAGQNSYQIDK
jgi:hypothetical protein